jgi:cytochrome c oxidase subunit IV
MSETTPQAPVTRLYLMAFVLLLFLTAVEAATVLVFRIPPALRVTILLVSALVKATLIGAYYMNLKFERLAMILIATTPLVLGILMFFAIVPDAARILGMR